MADIILKLNRKNDYGARDTLVYCAGEYLSEPIIRTMIATLEKRAAKEEDEYGRRRHLMLIESLPGRSRMPNFLIPTMHLKTRYLRPMA